MKTTLYILIAIILLSSCKSGSFLHQRYTSLHVVHVHKTLAAPAIAKTTKHKMRSVPAEMRSVAAVPVSVDSVAGAKDPGKKNDERMQTTIAKPTIKRKKAMDSSADLLIHKTIKKQKERKDKHKDKKDKEKQKEENSKKGGVLAVFILLLAIISGLLLSLLAYFILAEGLAGFVLLLLCLPFVVLTLILLMVYHSSGYRQWVVLTYIGACLLIIPAVLVFFLTYISLR